jgi:hypothetical protein
MAANVSATAGDAPEPPRAIPLSRTAKAARTCGVGNGRPIPPLCDMTRNSCSPRISSSVSSVSLPWPTWVVRPYTASLRARARSTTARLAAIASRTPSASSTCAPSTIASKSSRASGFSVMVTVLMDCSDIAEGVQGEVRPTSSDILTAQEFGGLSKGEALLAAGQR